MKANTQATADRPALPSAWVPSAPSRGDAGPMSLRSNFSSTDPVVGCERLSLLVSGIDPSSTVKSLLPYCNRSWIKSVFFFFLTTWTTVQLWLSLTTVNTHVTNDGWRLYGTCGLQSMCMTIVWFEPHGDTVKPGFDVPLFRRGYLPEEDTCLCSHVGSSAVIHRVRCVQKAWTFIPLTRSQTMTLFFFFKSPEN